MRNYRSDDLLLRRYEGSLNSELDMFAGVWQFGYNDTIDVNQDNPYDPQDTQNYKRFDSSNGGSVHFLQSDPTQILGHGYGFTYTDLGSTGRLNNGRGEVRDFRELLAHTPYPMISLTWSDGYKITFTRDSTTDRLTRMSDNRSNVADFTYNQNVVPGADRPLVSEITLSRMVSGSPVAFGKLLYTYQALTYGSGTNAFSVVRQPLIQSVNYVDLATSAVTPVRRYSYSPEAGADLFAVPALLTSISDGTVDGSGNPVAFANYTYAYYGFNQRGFRTNYGVASTQAAGVPATTNYGRTTGNVYEATNTKGLKTTYDFNQTGLSLRLASINGAASTGVLATAQGFSYGPPGLLSQKIERNGSRTTYTRDARGLVLTRTEDADGTVPRITSYTWHATLRLPLTRVTDGLTETFTYDSAGLLLTYSQTDTRSGSPTLGQVRTWTYGYTALASGLKVMTTLNGPGLVADGITDVTTYTYAASGEVATVTDPNGLVTTVISRNAQGQPTVVEQPDLNRWTFAYDVRGRVINSSYAGPGLTPVTATYAYNLSDQITSYTDTRGKIWTFTYDTARRLIEIRSATNGRIAYTYDTAGNVTRTEYRYGTSPVTFSEDAEFDALSRLLRTTGAMGQVWNYAHDREDNETSETDPLTFTTTNGFDALNRMVSTVDRGSFTETMKYNPADQETEYTDPRTIKTTFTYNGFGEVVTELSADRGTTSYAYDRRGLVTSRTDGRGVVVGYLYDNGGRLTKIDYPTGGLPDIVFTWDTAFLGVPASANKGKIGRITDGVITNEFGHQVLVGGPRVQTIGRYPAARNYTVTEESDFEGNVTRTIYPSAREVLVDYDDDSRIRRIRWKDGATTTTLVDTIAYRAHGPVSSMLYGDGYTQTRTYDQSYRQIGVTDLKSGSPALRQLTYGYEGRDNLASISDALVPVNSETFGYTPREHLTSANGPYGSLGFTYDGVGNRLTSVKGAVTDSYIYPATSNRLSSITLGAGGSRPFTYDGAGNVITDTRSGTVYGYTYNSAGRLSALSVGGVAQATYRYDAMGRQVTRTLVPSGVTIHSVFDSQGRRIAEYNEATGAIIREYVWMGWDPVAVIEGGVIYLIRADHIGRPSFATTLAGTRVWSAVYLPFGGVHVTTGAPIDARFPGQWFQTEAGLYQNWMRDYDPTTGRYIEADPLGLIDGASVYGYALQNPGRYTDPRGEFGLAGALLGAGSNLGIQLLVNYYRYGDLQTAAKCIDFKDVALSAGLGFLGASPLAMIKAKRYGSVAGVIAVNTWTKKVTVPTPLRIGDECECSYGRSGSSDFLDFLKTLFL